MPESPGDSRSKEGQATAALAAAAEILAELESAPEGQRRDAPSLLLQASFWTRLAAALLLEPDFPTLPEGLERLLDRDRARHAARHLSESRRNQDRSFSKSAAEPSPRRNPGAPITEADRRLAAETAATLKELEMSRLDLFSEYLQLWSDPAASANREVQAASLALLDRYWRSQRRLPAITIERPAKPLPRWSLKGFTSQLHRPHWEHDVTWELWRMMDPRYLFWSDPVPPPPPAAESQEL